jgi:hypothetical protein
MAAMPNNELEAVPSLSVEEIAARQSAVEATSQALQLEISKALLTGTLATTRGAIQVLQGVTGIMLASYTALLGAFGKTMHVSRVSAVVLASPIICYVVSLLIGFGQVLLYRGARITLGDLASGVEAFESVVSKQRRQLILPLIFLLLGMGAVTLVIVKILRAG